MRAISFLILVFCLSYAAKSNVLVDGYIIPTGQDTLACKIKIGGKKKVTNYTTLVIVTEEGEEKVYLAKDKLVSGYGFEYLGEKFHYRFAEIKKTYESGFFRLIDDGKKYKLYVNLIRSSYNGIVTTQPHYTLYKPNGEYVDLTTHLLGNWKKNLQYILADNPDALKELESVKRNEIPDFIKKLNNVE